MGGAKYEKKSRFGRTLNTSNQINNISTLCFILYIFQLDLKNAYKCVCFKTGGTDALKSEPRNKLRFALVSETAFDIEKWPKVDSTRKLIFAWKFVTGHAAAKVYKVSNCVKYQLYHSLDESSYTTFRHFRHEKSHDASAHIKPSHLQWWANHVSRWSTSDIYIRIPLCWHRLEIAALQV